MGNAAPNLLVDMLTALSVSSGADPVVLYSDPVMQPFLALLPPIWHVKVVDAKVFAPRVSDELGRGPVIAIPPWGRAEGTAVSREVEALEGIQADAGAHSLLLLLPGGFLVAAASKQIRMEIAKHWHFSAVATCVGELPDIHHDFVTALIKLEQTSTPAGVLRMFRVPPDWRSSSESVIEDFRSLLRRAGGRSKFGYVLREPLMPGAPLDFQLHDPEVARRRAALAEYGRVAHLDHLFEVVRGEPALSRLKRDQVSADTPGSRRLITGRDVQREHVIASPDDKCAYVTSGQDLQSGDIVLRSIQALNSIYPGLVWARVTHADLPAVPADTVLVLRPRPGTSDDEIEFVLRFLGSRHALELSENVAVMKGLSRITPAVLAGLRVPLPDEHLAEALRSVEQARTRAATWAVEADQILDALFEHDSATISRQNVIERSRAVRLRIQAVDDVDTLSGQVRTQYPLPIAYNWRIFEALRSAGPTREAYLACLDAAEQTLAFTANVGLALAREGGLEIGALRSIKTKLARRQGPSIRDWADVLDELARPGCSAIDDLFATTEFRAFCGDQHVVGAREDLIVRRNNEAHQRRVDSMTLPDACEAAVSRLEVLLKALDFWLDTPLVIAKSMYWDSLEQSGSLQYQRLAGDHPIVSVRQMPVRSSQVEAESLYLLDSKQRLHLLRPFLIGTNCEHCGAFSIFHVDRLEGGNLLMKSMEHSHTIAASATQMRAARAVGFLPQPDE